MGVPKFFRYISERYPCLSEVIKEYQIPEFDNLYLDMNGIIHNCSHPNDNDPHFRITEKQIFQDIFHYIEILFRMIQPKQLFFMAIDGVAPRAKMNQQRGRRFRSAKEAEECEKKARDKGEKLPTEKRFDSNCITPGTPFMCRLHQQLRYFVNLKMTTDKLWKNVKVILSGHETPGEGEHKIMDYIRFMKSKSDYNPNLRHCLYGLDADLIMLGLCTHDPYFSLLREEVKFNQKSNKGGKVIVTPEETKFFLLHLSLMRDYLELEFSQLKEPGVLSFSFDIEKIIDDWILMGFLIGNDFIPNLPDLHIIDGAMPLMYKVYREVLPTMEGYINEQGYLNLPRFEKFMTKLASFDFEQFREKYADIQYLEGKTNKKFSSVFHKDKKDKAMDPDLAALIKATDDELDMDDFTDEVLNYADYEEYYYSDEDEEWRKNFFTEFGQLKTDYYHYKLNYAKVTNEVLQDQAECYIRAIQWNLHYYYNGCISWSWYYPHHYAPYISDIKNFSNLNLKYEMGEPFLPFQQLLAVLPGASKDLLPKPYQDLMTLENSPIVEYYPEEFETDLNGKKVEWEAVVLIPFIDEVKLIKAMDDVEHLLTVEERFRNRHGPMLVYSYTNEHLGVALAPEYFPPIQENHALERTMYKDDIYVHPSKLKKGLCKNVNMNLYRTHFPTLKLLTFTHKIEMAKVVVFQQPSRNESFIVQLQKTLSPSLKQVADQILGKTILINYPHLVEIRVQAVSTKDCRISYDHVNGPVIEKTTKDISDRFQLSKKSITEDYFKKQGVEIGNTDILVFGQPVESRKYVFGPRGKVTQQRTYIKTTNTYAYQTIVFNLPQTQDFLEFKTIDEIFYPGCQCFTLCNPYYGSEGFVISTVKDENSLIKLSLRVLHEPNLYDLVNMQDTTEYNYMPGYTVATKLSISPLLLSRFTGSIFIIDSLEDNMRRKNIGLNIKFNKKNEEVVGFTRRDESSKKWFYTDNVVTLIKDFMRRFPEVFNFLKDNSSNDIYIRDEVFPNQGEARVNEIVNWLKEQPHSKAEVRRCGAQVVDEHVVNLIEQAVDSFEKTEKRMTLLVKPNKLYIPKPTLDKLCADPSTKFELFDRVVNVRDCYTVPLGYRGTVIGIIHGETSYDTMYDVVFDKPFPHGVKIRCSESRGYRMPAQALINLTHGERLHGNSNPYTKNINSTRTRNDRNTNFAQTTRQSSEHKPFTPSNTHSFRLDRTPFSFPRENSPVKLGQQVIKSASNSAFSFPKESSTIKTSLQVEAQYPTRVSRSNSQQSSISQSPSNSNTISHQSSPCNTLSYDKAESVKNNNPIANVLQNVGATTNQKTEDRLKNERKPIINKERCIFSNATPLIPTTQNSELFTGGLSFFGPKNILDIPENKNKLFTGEITQSKVNTDEEAIFNEITAQIKNVYIDSSKEHKPNQRAFSRTLSEKSESGFNISLTDLVKQNNITAATDFPTTGGLLSEIKSGHEEKEDIKDTSFTTKLTQMFNRSNAHSNEEEKVKQATPSVIQTSPQEKEYQDVVIIEKSSLKCKTEMTPTIKTEMRKVTPTPGVEEEEEEVMIIEMSEDVKPEPSIPSHKSFQEFLSQLKSNHLTQEDTVDIKTIPTLGDLEGKPFVEEEDISTLEELETISITGEPEICNDINTFTANTINEFFAQASRRQDLEQKEKVSVPDIKQKPVESTEPMVHQLFAQVSRRQDLEQKEKVPVPDIKQKPVESTEPMVHQLFAQVSKRQGLEKVPVPNIKQEPVESTEPLVHQLFAQASRRQGLDISEPVGSTEPLIHELFAQASRRHDLEQKDKVPVSDIKPEPIVEPVSNKPSDASDVLKKMLNIKSLASAAMSLPTVETFKSSTASDRKSPRVSVLPMPSSSRRDTTQPAMTSSFPMQTNTSSRNIFSNPPEASASLPQTSYSLFETAQSDTVNKPVSAFAAVPSQETRRSTNVLSNFQTRSHHLNPSAQNFIPPQVQKQHVDKMKPLSKWQSKYEAAIYQPPAPPPRGIPILGSQSAVYQQPQASPYQQQQHQYYHNQQGQPIYYQQQTPYPQNNLARAQNAYANQPQMMLTQSNQTHIPTQQFFPSNQVQMMTQQQTPNVWSQGQHYETLPAQSSSSQFMPYQGYQGQGYLRATQPRQTAHVQPVNHVKQETPSLAQNIQAPQPSAMVETPAFEEQDSYLFKLLNLTRIYQLGTPEYNFTVEGSNNHMASVRIAHHHSDIVVRGKPCSRKSDAAEVCARRAFNELTQIYPPTKQKITSNKGGSQPQTGRTEQTIAPASDKRYTGGVPKVSEQGVESEQASSNTNTSEEKKKQPRIAAKFNVPLKPKT